MFRLPDLMPKVERHILAHVAVRALPAISSRVLDHLSHQLFGFTERLAEHLGVEVTTVGEWSVAESRRELLDRVSKFRAALPKLRKSGLDGRLDWLAKIVGLTALDREILGHLVRAQLFEPYCQLLQFYHEGPSSFGEVHIEALSALLGRNPATILKRLEPASPLLDSGLIRDCRGGDWCATQFALRVARMRTTDENRLAAGLLGNEVRASLGWEEFQHLGALAELARTLVKEGARRKRGINILLYGVPGTGKSEFAATLAAECGLTGVLVGATDDDGREPERSERLGHLAICRSLVSRSSSHVLIVDEAEDLMIPPLFKSGPSKLYLNRLVERSTVPTIWIINDQELMGGPVIRRMSLAIEFPLPSTSVRRTLASRIARSERVTLEANDIERLAALNVAPAIVRHAVRAAAWSKGGIEDAVLAASSVARALGQRTPKPIDAQVAPFEPSFSLADCDLEALASTISENGFRAWSLLASGPPGTGKSAFARHLAKRLDIAVVEKRASDLLGMYVGNTEKAIAAAFREAIEQKAMLVIDEADSLLRDRNLAERSWEVSMTNEMLRAMEDCPVPFVATTNLVENLDPACTRRFLFKVRLQSLDAQRAEQLFSHMFGCKAPTGLASLFDLTPGDFALVARKSAILGISDPDGLLALLSQESSAKPGAARMKVGFG
nr:AAA family ATPase [uncultured Sphingomonas sp.]